MSFSTSTIAPLTPLTSLNDPFATSGHSKMVRSYSVSSSFSSASTSSTYSRSAEDMLDRLAAQQAHSTIHLWSAGNIRLNGRDLTIPTADTADLIEQLKSDKRFEVLSVVYLDGHLGDDWKMSVRRTAIVAPGTPGSSSDSE